MWNVIIVHQCLGNVNQMLI